MRNISLSYSHHQLNILCHSSTKEKSVSYGKYGECHIHIKNRQWSLASYKNIIKREMTNGPDAELNKTLNSHTQLGEPVDEIHAKKQMIQRLLQYKWHSECQKSVRKFKQDKSNEDLQRSVDFRLEPERLFQTDVWLFIKESHQDISCPAHNITTTDGLTRQTRLIFTVS